MAVSNAYFDGYNTYLDGYSKITNPYNEDVETNEYHDWERGYDDAAWDD